MCPHLNSSKMSNTMEESSPTDVSSRSLRGHVWNIAVCVMTVTVALLLCDLLTSLKYSLDTLTANPDDIRDGSRNVTLPDMFGSFKVVARVLWNAATWLGVTFPLGGVRG